MSLQHAAKAAAINAAQGGQSAPAQAVEVATPAPAEDGHVANHGEVDPAAQAATGASATEVAPAAQAATPAPAQDAEAREDELGLLRLGRLLTAQAATGAAATEDVSAATGTPATVDVSAATGAAATADAPAAHVATGASSAQSDMGSSWTNCGIPVREDPVFPDKIPIRPGDANIAPVAMPMLNMGIATSDANMGIATSSQETPPQDCHQDKESGFKIVLGTRQIAGEPNHMGAGPVPSQIDSVTYRVAISQHRGSISQHLVNI